MTIEQMQGSNDKRIENDFYRTPPFATKALIDREEFRGLIWEPACGDGAMSKVLKMAKVEAVISTDLIYRGYGLGGKDFLTCEVPGAARVRNIVTNPPFRLATEFILRAISIAEEKVAMLLKLNALAGRKRYSEIYSKYPPSRIYIFVNRLNFDRGDEKAKPGGGIAGICLDRVG